MVLSSKMIGRDVETESLDRLPSNFDSDLKQFSANEVKTQ